MASSFSRSPALWIRSEEQTEVSYASSAVLSDGRTLIAWQVREKVVDNPNDPNAYHYENHILTQMISADGKRLGQPVYVTHGWRDDDLLSPPHVDKTSTGQFQVSWSVSVEYRENHWARHIFSQPVDDQGQKVGMPKGILPQEGVNQDNLVITNLANGKTLLTWAEHGSGSGWDQAAQIYGQNGLPQSAKFFLHAPSNEDQYDAQIVTLPDGGFLAVWTDFVTFKPDVTLSSFGGNIMGAFFDKNGSKVGSDFQINSQSRYDQLQPDAVRLKNGQFMIFWADDYGGGDTRSTEVIRGQIVGADGQRLGDSFRINGSDLGAQTAPDAISLNDGRVLVTWSDLREGSESVEYFDIYAQILNPDGTKSGQAFVLNTRQDDFQQVTDLDLLRDGRVMVTWLDVSPPDEGGPRSGSAVVQIIDPRLAAVKVMGSAQSDRLMGTRWNDTLVGGVGGDTLLGSAGKDRLTGGEGADILRGGVGVDRLVGGRGVDIFVFVKGAEAFGDKIADFRHGVDKIDLSAFMDGGQFIGAKAFGGKVDQVRYVRAEGLLQGDVNGDGKADWSLRLTNEIVLDDKDFLF